MKDKVDNRSVKITDCLTEYMWADLNSKPIHGPIFRIMRDKLMNCGVDCGDPFWEK